MFMWISGLRGPDECFATSDHSTALCVVPRYTCLHGEPVWNSRRTASLIQLPDPAHSRRRHSAVHCWAERPRHRRGRRDRVDECVLSYRWPRCVRGFAARGLRVPVSVPGTRI